MYEPVISFEGRLTKDCDLTYTGTGKAKARFTVAVNPRSFVNGEWQDGEAVFLPCVLFGTRAETAVEVLMKGTRVTVNGRLSAWKREDGQQALTVLVDSLGATNCGCPC